MCLENNLRGDNMACREDGRNKKKNVGVRSNDGSGRTSGEGRGRKRKK